MSEEPLTSKQKDLEIRRLEMDVTTAKVEYGRMKEQAGNWRLEANRFREKWVMAEQECGVWCGRYKESRRPIVYAALAIAYLALIVATCVTAFHLGRAW